MLSKSFSLTSLTFFLLYATQLSAQQVVLAPPPNVNNQEAYVLRNDDFNDNANNSKVNISNKQPKATATKAIMPPNATSARGKIKLKNAEAVAGSQTAARLRGSIRGLGIDVYQFRALRGQRLQILSNKSNPAIELALFRSENGTLLKTSQVIPADGVYELRIVQIRKDAARNKTPRHYNIVVSIQ